ncbi:TPA: Trk system potassium transporter TrkA, partial [Streptococcus pneumoniae]
MKIILVGGGKVGFALCRSLVAEKHDVLLIEQDEAVLNHIVSRFDIIGILGNGADFAILEQASVQDCDIFIALTEHDEVNMIAAVLAKKMGAKETIVRVRNPEYSNSYFKEKNILGFSLIVNPELLAARAIANIIDFPNALSVERFAGGRVSLMEFVVKSTSGLCQMPISDFRKKFGNVIVCAIERDHQIIIPSGDMTVQDKDRIF